MSNKLEKMIGIQKHAGKVGKIALISLEKSAFYGTNCLPFTHPSCAKPLQPPSASQYDRMISEVLSKIALVEIK